MAITSSTQVKAGTALHPAVAGALAGLAGGVVFGMLMGMMGMLPMIAMLVRQDSVAVGFAVHMVISAFIGAVYGLIAARLPGTVRAAVAAGMLNGMFWWVAGALVLMPLGLGMASQVLAVGPTQWMSLMGHLIYGIVTALAFRTLPKR